VTSTCTGINVKTVNTEQASELQLRNQSNTRFWLGQGQALDENLPTENGELVVCQAQSCDAPPASGGGGGQLPTTGTQTWMLLAAGGLLLVVGGALFLQNRKRRGEPAA